MSRTLTLLVTILIICLIVATLGGLLWGNMRYVRTYPLEKDFLIPWLGARTFLEYGDSPYDTPATQRAQIVYYGRLAAEGQDPLILSLPLPVELFYFPFALIKDYPCFSNVLHAEKWNAFFDVSWCYMSSVCYNRANRVNGFPPPPLRQGLARLPRKDPPQNGELQGFDGLLLFQRLLPYGLNMGELRLQVMGIDICFL